VEEELGAAEDLRALGAGGFALDRHEAASAVHHGATVRAWWRSAEIWTTTTGAFALAGVLMLAGGWLLHRGGAITVGTVFLLFQYVQVLRRPVEVLAEQLQEVQRAAAGAARLRSLLDERPGIDFPGTARLPDGPLALRLEGVTFGYPDDRVPVLRD